MRQWRIFLNPHFFYPESNHPRFLAPADGLISWRIGLSLLNLCWSISVSSQPISCAIHSLVLICARPCCAASRLCALLSSPPSLTPPLPFSPNTKCPLSPSLLC